MAQMALCARQQKGKEKVGGGGRMGPSSTCYFPEKSAISPLSSTVVIAAIHQPLRAGFPGPGKATLLLPYGGMALAESPVIGLSYTNRPNMRPHLRGEMMGVDAAETGGRPDRGTRKESAALRKVVAPRSVSNRSKVSNNADILPGIDGRSATARRFHDVIAALISDQGGLDLLTEARFQLVRRFAACSVLAERMEARLANGETIDISEHSQLSSTLVRLASRIGIERRAHEIVPTLVQYLEQRERELEVAEE